MLLVVTDDRFFDHDSGPSHPERPGRLTAALDGIELAGATEAVVRRTPRTATQAEITAVHDLSLVEQIRGLAAAGGGRIDADTSLGPAIEAFNPDWLLISAGFDGHRDDPLTQLMYSSGDIADFMANLIGLVGRRRVVTVLEGGYDLAAITRSSAGVVGCLVGHDA